MKHFLFICTGNTCRSPMAEYLLKAMDRENFEVQSAGLAAIGGQEAHEHVKQLLADRGIEINHKSRPVSKELMDWADVVLTMTQSHAQVLKERYPDHAHLIFPLIAYVDPKQQEVDIADPFGGDRTLYENTLREIEQWLKRLLEKEKFKS